MRCVLVVVTLLAVTGLASSCKRACLSADNCKRTCDCTDENTGDTERCTIGFLCEKEEGGSGEGTCEEEFDSLACEDVCQKYAAKNLCGTNRCTQDAECRREMSCTCNDASGNPTQSKFECKIGFECDPGDKTCDVNFTRTDEDLCATNCRTGTTLPAGCF